MGLRWTERAALTKAAVQGAIIRIIAARLRSGLAAQIPDRHIPTIAAQTTKARCRVAAQRQHLRLHHLRWTHRAALTWAVWTFMHAATIKELAARIQWIRLRTNAVQALMGSTT